MSEDSWHSVGILHVTHDEQDVFNAVNFNACRSICIRVDAESIRKSFVMRMHYFFEPALCGRS